MNRRSFARAFITGIAGSGGSYLAEHLVTRQPGVQVHGLSRWHSTTSLDNLEGVRGRVTIHEADLTDFVATYRAIVAARPDVIFHLAAYANVRESFNNPTAVLDNNIRGTVNLFEAIRLAEVDPVVLLCSTSEVYGQVDPENVPITEQTPFRPASPYGVSKVAQDLLGRTYFVSYGMKIITTRMFTYINPRRSDLFATSFARQVALIEAGFQEELTHGNLESVRTMIDVRDAMRAYWEAAERCEPGEVYNIGGSKTMTVGQFLDLLKHLAKKEIPTRVDQRLLRPADVTLQIPSVEKFRAATGWEPKHTFEESVEFLLNYWRERVRLLGKAA